MRVSELSRRVARLFVIGFTGPSPDRHVRGLIDDGVGGVILFKRNVESAAQVAELVKALKTHAGRPLLLSVDQEGGRVARLRGAPFTALPPMREVGKSRDVGLARRVGRLLAYEVRALGFDQDYAPVLDVDTNPKNPVIGDRALHHDAQEVARMGVALAQGLEDGGVASCGKHFPGHGDTAKDSHTDLPTLPHDLARLRQVELVPFAAYAKAGLASLMTAHVVFEAVHPKVPATMSRPVLTGVLRDELGFNGVVVSDDLEMKAIADHFSVARAAVEGLKAGADQFLVCHHEDVQRGAIEAVVKAVESGEVSPAQLDAAVGRVDALLRRFVRGPEDGLAKLGSAEHRALAQGLEASAFAGVDPTERA
jgi:beta-N-acetylhexosaminidase